MNFKYSPLYFVLLSLLFFNCKKDKGQPEPKDGGEIIFDNSTKASLDTARIILSENLDGAKKHLIFELRGVSKEGEHSLLLVLFQVPLEIQEIPEGQFVLKGDDFFHFSVRNSPGDPSISGYLEKQMTFYLHKIGESRYSVEFNGVAKGKTVSGNYSGYWGKLIP